MVTYRLTTYAHSQISAKVNGTICHCSSSCIDRLSIVCANGGGHRSLTKDPSESANLLAKALIWEYDLNLHCMKDMTVMVINVKGYLLAPCLTGGLTKWSVRGQIYNGRYPILITWQIRGACYVPYKNRIIFKN